VPLQIGVLQSPSPSGRRCYKLGQALADFQLTRNAPGALYSVAGAQQRKPG